MLIKQSDTTKPIPFLMVDETDHLTGLTGLTPTVTISKNSGSFAAPSGSVSEVGNGWYALTPASADVSTLGPLMLHATATGADPTDVLCRVVAFDPDNATSLGISYLDAAVASRSSHSAADVRSEIDSSSTQLAAIKATTDKVDDTLEDDLGVYRFTMNALEQAPAGGGGGGATAADVWSYGSRTLTSATGNVTIVSPADENGQLTLYRGDDYTTGTGTAIDFTPDDVSAWPDLTGATVTFRAEKASNIDAAGEATLTKGMTVVSTVTKQIRLELSNTDTDGLAEGFYAYKYAIDALLPSTEKRTLQAGTITVRDSLR